MRVMALVVMCALIGYNTGKQFFDCSSYETDCYISCPNSFSSEHSDKYGCEGDDAPELELSDPPDPFIGDLEIEVVAV